jgi:hypothetical protein
VISWIVSSADEALMLELKLGHYLFSNLDH